MAAYRSLTVHLKWQIAMLFFTEVVNCTVTQTDCVNHVMLGSRYFSLAYRKKSEGEDGASKSKEDDAEKYPQSRRLLSPKKHFA